MLLIYIHWIDLSGFPSGSEGKASACNAGDLGSIPGSGISPGRGNGNPLQYSCLENSMDREAWQALVHWVAKSRTRLSDFTFPLSSALNFWKLCLLSQSLSCTFPQASECILWLENDEFQVHFSSKVQSHFSVSGELPLGNLKHLKINLHKVELIMYPLTLL